MNLVEAILSGEKVIPAPIRTSTLPQSGGRSTYPHRIGHHPYQQLIDGGLLPSAAKAISRSILEADALFMVTMRESDGAIDSAKYRDTLAREYGVYGTMLRLEDRWRRTTKDRLWQPTAYVNYMSTSAALVGVESAFVELYKAPPDLSNDEARDQWIGTFKRLLVRPPFKYVLP